MLDRYGTRAEMVAAAEAGTPFLDAAMAWSSGEIAWIVRNERVVHLSDIVLRRTALALTGQLTGPLLQRIAAIAGAELGWSVLRQDQEVRATAEELARRYRVALPGLAGTSGA